MVSVCQRYRSRRSATTCAAAHAFLQRRRRHHDPSRGVRRADRWLAPLDRIIQAGGYISRGGARRARDPRSSSRTDRAFEARPLHRLWCVRGCPNASAMLFTSAVAPPACSRRIGREPQACREACSTRWTEGFVCSNIGDAAVCPNRSAACLKLNRQLGRQPSRASDPPEWRARHAPTCAGRLRRVPCVVLAGRCDLRRIMETSSGYQRGACHAQFDGPDRTRTRTVSWVSATVCSGAMVCFCDPVDPLLLPLGLFSAPQQSASSPNSLVSGPC